MMILNVLIGKVYTLIKYNLYNRSTHVGWLPTTSCHIYWWLNLLYNILNKCWDNYILNLTTPTVFNWRGFSLLSTSTSKKGFDSIFNCCILYMYNILINNDYCIIINMINFSVLKGSYAFLSVKKKFFSYIFCKVLVRNILF